MASSGYRDLSRLASGDPEVNRDICLTNSESLVRWIDDYTAELQRFRQMVLDGSEDLGRTLVDVWEARARWITGKDRRDDALDMDQVPSSAEALAGLVMPQKIMDMEKRMGLRDEKKDKTKYRGRI